MKMHLQILNEKRYNLKNIYLIFPSRDCCLINFLITLVAVPLVKPRPLEFPLCWRGQSLNKLHQPGKMSTVGSPN
jgi:hypothetical protein